MARRFCVVLAVVALDSMLELQLAVCSLVCLIFLVLHVVYSPYASDEATLLSRLNVALGAHLAAEASVTSAQTTGRKETKTNGPDSYANPMNCSRSVKLENKSEILSRHVRGHTSGILRQYAPELTSTSHRLAVGLRIENDSSIQARQSLGDVPAGQETLQHDTEDGTENIRTIPAATARSVAAYGKRVSLVERNALIANYITFYLALFIAGDAGQVHVWSDLVGIVVIATNVAFTIFFISVPKNFHPEAAKEGRTLGCDRCCQGESRYYVGVLEEGKPPIQSADAIHWLDDIAPTRSAEASGGASSSEVEMSSIEGTRILPDGFEEFFDKESISSLGWA